jgi:hypothetical protein
MLEARDLVAVDGVCARPSAILYLVCVLLSGVDLNRDERRVEGRGEDGLGRYIYCPSGSKILWSLTWITKLRKRR